MYDLLLVRIGELTLKGRNRKRFERALARQVKTMLADFPNLRLTESFGRMYVELADQPWEPVAQRLQLLFGIGSISPAVKVAHELEVIQAAAVRIMAPHQHKPLRFKAVVRRVLKDFPHTSQEMNRLVGGYVLHQYPNLRVDVHHPEIELGVEIQPEGVYLFCERLPGAGGFPYGSNGKALLLLSGGIDSPVAAWYAMRKGLEIEAVHFHSYPFTSEQAKDKVIALARQLAAFTGKSLRLHLIRFTDIQTAFTGAKQDPLMITLMRRSMLRLAEQLALQRAALALVTGESVGQVASQTLSSMNVIGRAAQLPLLRPLVMYEKQEIVAEAKRIGTYATSVLPYADCCTLFVPKSPSTNPNLRVVEKVEQFVPRLQELEQEALESVQVLEVAPAAVLASVPASSATAQGARQLSEAEQEWF